MSVQLSLPTKEQVALKWSSKFFHERILYINVLNEEWFQSWEETLAGIEYVDYLCRGENAPISLDWATNIAQTIDCYNI